MFVAAAVIGLTPIAPAAAAPLGTGFTYQGILSDGGGPANGSFDLRFILYDADSGGSQVGSTLTVEDVGVIDGRVVATLDFGAVFSGDAVWLEVAVRDGASTGGFTVLSPRQPLTGAPYAQHAVTADTAGTAASATSAGFASSAGDAAQLNGQDPSYYLAWTNLTGVPAGLADGDDDTLAGLTCGDGQVVSWSGGAWICADAADALASTFVVSPAATAVASGTALLAAVAALPAASENAPLLVKLEPGVYDLGAGQLTLPEWVDLEGSGRDATTITGATCGANLSGSTLVIAGRSEVRELTVENTCATINVGIAIYANAGARITGAHAVSAGDAGNSMGIIVVGAPVTVSDTIVTVLDGASDYYADGISTNSPSGVITLENVDILGSGNFDTMNGIYAWGNAKLTLRNVSVSLTGSSTTVRGLYVYDAARIDARDLVVEASTTGGVAGQNAVFIQPPSGAEVVLKDLWVRGLNNVAYAVWAEGGGSWSIDGADVMAPEAGMVAAARFAGGGTFIISGSTMRGGDSGLLAYIEGSNTVIVEVTNSVVQGPVNAAWTNVPSPTVRIGGSMLSGGPVSGNFTCAGVWNENFAFSASGCP
jgi:hypothetical protein